MTMRARTTSVIAAGLALFLGGATDCGQIISDRGFDLWCGESLCTWVLEKGEVKPAATWHDSDSGVEMVGDDVAISQLTDVVDSDGHCVRLTMVADIDEAAEVRLQVDVFDDGLLESDERIPTSDWRQLTYLIRMPQNYSGVRFRLTKRGNARAVLANIGAEIEIDEACPNPPIAATRPDGAVCVADGDCTSGQCFEWLGDWPDICGECDGDDDCTGGELCTVGGSAPSFLSVSSHCWPPGSLAISQRCLRNEHCATGACVDGRCNECDQNADCAGGSCYASAALDVFLCNATREPGARCYVGADCDSGTCTGTPLLGCNGSPDRECVTADDCPVPWGGTVATCDTVGFVSGTCQ
jgi:hypothetical protein